MDAREYETAGWWSGASACNQLLLTFCRRVPQFRGKRRIYQAFARWLLQNEVRVQNPQEAQLLLDPSDYIGRMIAFEGNYESKSIALGARILAGGGVFLDIGCNFGLYTVSLGNLPGVKVVAIDASFLALTRLRQNLGFNPRIHAQVVNCALASANGFQRFHLPEVGNLGTMKIDDRAEAHDQTRFWAAGVVLQEVLEQLKPGKITLLKIDVEGFELEVFKGLDFQGPFRPENMIVECDLEFPHTAECFRYLVAQGYVPMDVEGHVIHDCAKVPEINVWFRSSR